MKTLVTLLILGLLVSSAMAGAAGPIDKGSMMLDGSVYFWSGSGDLYKDSDGNSQTQFGIMPSFGYFVAPSILVGGDVDFTQWKQGDYKNTFFGIGPTVGYYFNMDKEATEAKGTIIPYVRVFFMYGKNKDTYPDGSGGTTDSKQTQTSFGGQGGIIYMISNSVGANFSVMFSSDKIKDDDTKVSVKGTSLEVGGGISCFIF